MLLRLVQNSCCALCQIVAVAGAKLVLCLVLYLVHNRCCNWWKIVEKQEEILVFLPLGTRTLVMKLSSQFCLAYLKSFLDHGVI